MVADFQASGVNGSVRQVDDRDTPNLADASGGVHRRNWWRVGVMMLLTSATVPGRSSVSRPGRFGVN